MENNEKKDVEIIPAILSENYFDIETAMERVVGVVPVVQIDVIDGVFVKGKRTWPYINVPDEHFNILLREEESFPFWDSLEFEVDLMVADPLSVWQDWITVGAKRIIAHVESISDTNEFIHRIKEMGGSHDAFFYVESGIALNIDTPIESIENIVPHVDVVQCMGIKEIGAQGQVFDIRVVDKIKEIKKRFPQVLVSVDGGVNADSAHILIDAGVDRLVSGSFIFGSEDVEERVEELKNIR